MYLFHLSVLIVVESNESIIKNISIGGIPSVHMVRTHSSWEEGEEGNTVLCCVVNPRRTSRSKWRIYRIPRCRG